MRYQKSCELFPFVNTNYVGVADKLVAFHDILPNPVPTTEVSGLWNELKATRSTLEFCERWGNRLMGIGVVLLGGADRETVIAGTRGATPS